jgi:hypothetical protein
MRTLPNALSQPWATRRNRICSNMGVSSSGWDACESSVLRLVLSHTSILNYPADRIIPSPGLRLKDMGNSENNSYVPPVGPRQSIMNILGVVRPKAPLISIGCVASVGDCPEKRIYSLYCRASVILMYISRLISRRRFKLQRKV